MAWELAKTTRGRMQPRAAWADGIYGGRRRHRAPERQVVVDLGPVWEDVDAPQERERKADAVSRGAPNLFGNCRRRYRIIAGRSTRGSSPRLATRRHGLTQPTAAVSPPATRSWP